jgi:hypothetical protein
MAGAAAMRLGLGWLLVLGVVLLIPGVPGIYLSFGIHRLILIGDVRLTIVGVLINAVVWHVIAVASRRSRDPKRRLPN